MEREAGRELPLTRMKILSAAGWLGKIAGLKERRCQNCLTPFEADNSFQDLCTACAKLLKPYTGAACPLCGEPFMNEICSICVAGRPWERMAFHGLYEGELRNIIRRLKYGGELSLAPFLAHLLLEAAKCLRRPDGIVPLPQYPPHLGKRGFNHAFEIARHLAGLGGWPLLGRCLKRTRQAHAQASLDRASRLENVKDNFCASELVAGKHIWLVDDVMTTGSTLEASAKSLKAAGCGEISLLFAARTPFVDTLNN